MNNLIELSSRELNEVAGGATFAYRVGQALRYIAYSQTAFGYEGAYYLVYWQ